MLASGVYELCDKENISGLLSPTRYGGANSQEAIYLNNPRKKSWTPIAELITVFMPDFLGDLLDGFCHSLS